MFDFGINKVLLANQLLGKSHLETIASYINQNKNFSFIVLLILLSSFLNKKKNLGDQNLTNPINLLPEIGAENGRTGIRKKEDFLKLVNIIERTHQRILLLQVYPWRA